MNIARAINDNQREEAQAKIFGLKLLQGRSNKYNPDVTFVLEKDTLYGELKTYSCLKSGVSTARGVKQKKIEEWRSVNFWLFSAHDNGKLTDEHYVLVSSQMEEFFQQMEEKLLQGSKKLAGINDWNKAIPFLEGNISDELLEKLNYAFLDKGCALNDPKIPLSYIRENGTKVSNEEALVKVLKEYL